ncbi:DUF4349 domain-containing protein [Candidatus Woesearchaeota archaeon]|nr:MAG: DUF4349 domain-containing protein [Candidatus Woesearchaeota archaeon]
MKPFVQVACEGAGIIISQCFYTAKAKAQVMSLKKQWQTVKDNWLIVSAVVLFLLLTNFSGISSISSVAQEAMGGYAGMDMARSGMPYPVPGNFYPEVEERKKTVFASLRTEVETGLFAEGERRAKLAFSDAGALLVSESVNVYETGRKEYRRGSYQVKVPVDGYAGLVLALKGIGEVKSFSENVQDITEQYVDAQANLDAEKARLARYQAMFKEATRTEDKITLSDRIFEQERTIRYLEDAVKNVNKQVQYSSLSFELEEKRPKYAEIVFVRFSQLVKNLVDNVNAVLTLLFSLVPWAFVALIGFGVWKLAKRK